MRISSRKLSNQHPKRYPKLERKSWRIFTWAVVFTVGVLFIYHFISEQGFLSVKQIAIAGNTHYTQTEIITASGLNYQRDNVHTISARQIERELKQKLSYVKNADISKNVMKRSLTIQITEREPAAVLKYYLNGGLLFVLVDFEGYVLEYKYSSSPQAPDAIVTIIGAGQQISELQLGNRVFSDHVQLALKVLRVAVNLSPEMVSGLYTIDANQPDKITLQFDNLPVVWLASDFIEAGLHHIDLFFKQQRIILQKRKPTSNRLGDYLDARFKDAIYWGNKQRG